MTVVRNSRRGIPRDPPQPYTPEYIALGLAPVVMEPKEERQMRQDFQRSREQRPFAHVGVHRNWLDEEAQIVEQQIAASIPAEEIQVPTPVMQPRRTAEQWQAPKPAREAPAPAASKNLNTYVLVICGKMVTSSDDIENVKEKIREAIMDNSLNLPQIPDIEDVCVYKRLPVSFDVLIDE
jgi:hypothetical protein